MLAGQAADATGCDCSQPRRYDADDWGGPLTSPLPLSGLLGLSPFIARYLRDRDLQREINAGLNVVENYNGVNDYIFFGKSGELSSNRREEQEISMICLQILQSCLGYINTLMIQDTLAEPEWADRLGDADRRGLTPLFTVNMTPYGEIQLNLDRRLNLAAGGPST